MKEQAIQKINKVGKISYVIAVIAKIFVIVGLVATLATAVICFMIPKDGVNMTMGGNMELEIDFEAMGEQITVEDIAEAEAMTSGQDMRVENVQFGMVNGGFGFSVAGQDYEPVDMEVDGNVMTVLWKAPGTEISMRTIAGVCLLAALALAMTMVTIIFIEKLCKAFRDCQSPFEENIIKKMQNLAIALIPWTLVSSISNSVRDSFMNGGINLSLTVDLGVVLVVLIVLVLVYIFKYGAVLQQESDETL